MTIASQLHFPPALKIKGSTQTGTVVNALAVFDGTSHVYRTVEVSISEPIGKVQGTTLRATPIREIMRAGLRQEIKPLFQKLISQHAPLRAYFAQRPASKPLSIAIAMRPSDRHIESAALVHTFASAAGDFPVLAVRLAFGLSRSSARRWVGLARAKGLIDG